MSNRLEHNMNDKQKKIFDYLYFGFLIIATINLFFMTTTFEYKEYQFVLQAIQIVLQFTVIVKVALEWRTEWSNKDILIGVLTAGILLACAYKFGNEDAFAYAFLIIGAKGIDKKKILKVFLIVNIIMFVSTIGFCLMGVLPNITTYRSTNSTHARMALGFIYTTSLSAHFLTMVVCYVMVREKRISIIEIILIGISSGVIYYLTEARIASFAIALIFCGLVVAKICYVKNIEFKLIRIPVLKYSLILSSALLMVISVLVGVFYDFDSTAWIKINNILSQRPIANAITFNRYPLSLLGEHVIPHCDVYDEMDQLPAYYYIINCSYINVLFTIGVLGAGVVLFIWTYNSYKEAKCDNYMNLFVMAIMALFFFFEQRMFDFVYNPLLILLLVDFDIEHNFTKNDIRVFDNFKESNSVLRCVLTGVVIAFTVEVVLFNYKSISTFLYEGTTIDSAEVQSVGFFKNINNDMYEYSTLEPMIILTGLTTYDDLESIFVDMGFRTKEDNYYYRQIENVQYSVDYYYSYDNSGTYDYLGTVEIDSSKRISGFLETPVVKGPTYNLLMQFHFPADYYVDIFSWEFNGPKPFDINYLRIIIMWPIIFGMICVVAKIRNKKLKIIE